MSKKPGELVPQPHGGALRHGSTPGNTPGHGRPPSELRRRLRGSFEQRIAVLEEFADGVARVHLHQECEFCGKPPSKPLDPEQLLEAIPKPADRLRALDLLAKYGLGTTKELTVEHVREKLMETIRAIREELDEEAAERVLRRIRPIWR